MNRFTITDLFEMFDARKTLAEHKRKLKILRFAMWVLRILITIFVLSLLALGGMMIKLTCSW